MEEFENKVDKIAAGQEENSWISGLYKRLSDNFGGLEDKMTPDQASLIAIMKIDSLNFFNSYHVLLDGRHGTPYS